MEVRNIEGNLEAVGGQDHEKNAKLWSGRNNFRGFMTKLSAFSVGLLI